MTGDATLLGNQIECLIDLGKKIKDTGLPETALIDSVFELTYILQRIKELAPALQIDTTSADQDQLNLYSRSTKALRFYSQCLLIWSCRIMDILKAIADIEVPPVIKLARNILAAHYGTADGNLKSKLTKESGFLVSPQFSPTGNFRYVIGPIGSPASTASPSELNRIEKLFKKYCPEEREFNWWYVCYKILHQGDRGVSKEDLKEIVGFIRNNGGMITDSQSVIRCVIQSVEKYVASDIE